MKLVPTSLFVIVHFLFGLLPVSVEAEGPEELTTLKSRFSGQVDLLQEPLRRLEAKYKMALEGVRDAYQKSGNLDGLVAARERLASLEKAPEVVGEPSKFEDIAKLQAIYRTSRESVIEEIRPGIVSVETTYRKQLEALMKSLTTEGRVDDALAVKAELEASGKSRWIPKEEEEITLETALVLHYEFDLDSGETVRDRSERENHARFVGDARIRSSSSQRKKHLYLDGDGDYIEAPHHESFILGDSLTISIWVRPDKLENLRGFVSTYTPNHSWTLRTWKDAERARVSFGDYEEGHRTTGELREGKWTHVVVTLDGSVLRFYLDGELDSEAKRTRPLQNSSKPLRIGSDYDGRYFQGEFDDVRIYKRALSAEEVQELFQVES